MDDYERIDKELERQEDELEELLNKGRITVVEYNKRMRQLQRDAREELQNAER